MTSDESQPANDFAISLLICLLLAAVTVFVYWPVHAFEFVNLDDPIYIYMNPHIRTGLTAENFQWALFTTFYDFWHPLTWWSHMLDCDLFGMDAGIQHLMNLAVHVANTVLVFGVLRLMTGRLWRSAMVAALFGLHPLHVESVAWLSERKDVLSTLFWLLCLWFYGIYVRRMRLESVGRRNWYWAALVCFALALMAKAMVVTLPFALLLLDFWPLNRFKVISTGDKDLPGNFESRPMRGLIMEKLPFFGLSLVSCLITYIGMDRGHNVLTSKILSWAFRFTNVPVSYVRYLGKMFWPVDLAVLYPIPVRWALLQWGGAAVVLVLVSVIVWRTRRSAPYLFVGWCWFLGTLVPTIGIVAMGYQAIADRYTYIPSIGLSAAVVWFVADRLGKGRLTVILSTLLAVLTLTPLAGIARAQVLYWRNSYTLWTHCLAVTTDNAFAHNFLGIYYESKGGMKAAREQYQTSLRINPDFLDTQLYYGMFLLNRGEITDATNYFNRALQISPVNAVAHFGMGLALFKLGNHPGSLQHLSVAAEASPENPSVATWMGIVLVTLNRSDEAIKYYERALHLDPLGKEPNYYLGVEWLKRGDLDAARTNLTLAAVAAPNWSPPHFQLMVLGYRQEMKHDPDSAETCNNFAWLLATCREDEVRNGPEAVELAEHACELTSNKTTVMVGTLAAAYAEAGAFDKAAATAQRACNLATATGDTNLLARNEALLEQFRDKKPYREK